MYESYTVEFGSRWVDADAAALGSEVTSSDDSCGMIEGNGITMVLGRVDRCQPPQWLDEAGAKRFHLDLQVDGLDEGTQSLCAIGASQPDLQPGAGRSGVLVDPDGQPLCLSPRPGGTP